MSSSSGSSSSEGEATDEECRKLPQEHQKSYKDWKRLHVKGKIPADSKPKCLGGSWSPSQYRKQDKSKSKDKDKSKSKDKDKSKSKDKDKCKSGEHKSH